MWRHQVRQSAEWFIIHVNVEFMHQGLKPPVCSRSARGFAHCANRMKRLWDVTVGNRFLSPQLRRRLLCLPEAFIKPSHQSAVFAPSKCTEVENCNNDVMHSRKHASRLCFTKQARPKHPGNIHICHLYHVPFVFPAKKMTLFQICHLDSALSYASSGHRVRWRVFGCLHVSIHPERVRARQLCGESQQSRHVSCSRKPCQH